MAAPLQSRKGQKIQPTDRTSVTEFDPSDRSSVTTE
jgi:hypothetical protein